MKTGNWVIYRGKNYPQRVGQKSQIIGMRDYPDSYGNRVWILKFEDNFESGCREDFLEEIEDGRSKIKKPEIDPFGEESWGYVQESIDDKFVPNEKEGFSFILYNKYIELRRAGGEYIHAYFEYVKKSLLNKNIKFFSADDYNNKEYYGVVTDVRLVDHVGVGICVKMENYSHYHIINIYIPIEFLDTGFSKIKKLEIDPFGEENWGYIQENLFTEKFNLGDRVRIDRNKVPKNEDDKLYYDKSKGGVGEIYNIEPDRTKYPYKVIWELASPSNNTGRYCFDELELVDGARKKIKKPEIDPFEEENWGYVKENKTEQEDFILGEIALYVGQRVEYYGQNVKIISMKSDRSRIYIIEFQDEVQHPCGNIFLKKTNNRKKIKNLEIDPFGEEMWGYIQESFEFDEDICIYVKNQYEYDNLMIELEKEGFVWAGGYKPTSMKYDVGHMIEREIVYLNLPIKNNLSYSSLEYFQNGFQDHYKHRNYKLINYGENTEIKYKKLKNLEIDPFGEEYWGYVEEN